MYRYRLLDDAAVEAQSCVNSDSHVSLDEQYTTGGKYSIAGCFGPKVFVNCLQLLSCKQLTKTFWSKRPAIEYLSTVLSEI